MKVSIRICSLTIVFDIAHGLHINNDQSRSKTIYLHNISNDIIYVRRCRKQKIISVYIERKDIFEFYIFQMPTSYLKGNNSIYPIV